MSDVDTELAPSDPGFQLARKKPAAKGELEAEVKRILDAYIMGNVTPAVDQPMTPHRISRLVMAERHLSGGTADLSAELTADRGAQLVELAFGNWNPRREAIEAVSAGAVTAMLRRWEHIGFATLIDKPVAFEGYTEAAVEVGMIELKARSRRAKGEARKADKTEGSAVADPGPATVVKDNTVLHGQQFPSGLQINADNVTVSESDFTDPAYAPPPGYMTGTEQPQEAPPAPPVDDGMTGAAHPVTGAQSVTQGAPDGSVRSPFGT